MLIMLKWMLEQQLIQVNRNLAGALLLLIHCLILLPLFVGTVCFVLVFVMHYSHEVSFLVLQSSWRERESWLLDFNCLPCGCQCSVALPRGAMGWSAVCVCGISCSYSLTIGAKSKTVSCARCKC